MGDPREFRTILLAEDDDAIAAIAREVLESEGYRVDVAPSHAAALIALAEARYALVLADTEGPPLADGEPAHWQSVESVRAAAHGIPVVIFSAHAPGAFCGYRERGFAGLISKPFELDELVTTVGALVGQP